MEVTCRATRLLIEATESAGISRASLVEGLDCDHLMNTRKRVQWTTMVALLERLSVLVVGDVERMRDVGAHMVQVPSYDFMQKLAGNLVSPQSLYESGGRWVAPALFPHVQISLDVLPNRRLRHRAEIPAPHPGSRPFYYIFEGVLCELPRLLGLPRASLEQSVVTPHTCDNVIVVPPSKSFLARCRQSLMTGLKTGNTVALLDAQRREIAWASDNLKRAAGEFHELLERLPEPVVIHRDGTMLWVNGVLLAMLGYDHSNELVGQSLSKIVADRSQGILSERLRTPPNAMNLSEWAEVRLLRREGGDVLVEVAPAQSVTFGGTAARLVLGRDVRERVRMQQRLVTADRLASLGLLAAGVAHEINNPLGYVLNCVEIAARELDQAGQPATASAQSALALALEGVGRVRTIVNDLRMLSRVEQVVQPSDVRAVLETTLGLARTEISDRATIVCDFQPTPLARVNPARLGQIFLNLIINALDAMPEQTPQNKLLLRTYQDATGSAVVEVTDTGVGIAPELVDRIFDPFFTTKADGRGTGLGLAICHQLVFELGGQISVQSVQGKGTTFRVSLPPVGD